MTIVERVWYGAGTAERVARAALAPAAALFGAAVRDRNARYDDGRRAVHDSALPVLSVGNLSVGGTGKTPVAAWIAGELLARGARPAIVMRGYGDDEPLVHGRLNRDAIIVADADRVAGLSRARALGADCAILDDGFQHRRVSRLVDWVLVSAERWDEGLRMLPAGPLREPVGSLARAGAVLVTRKSASAVQGMELLGHLARRFPGLPGALVALRPDGLVAPDGIGRRTLESLRGAEVLAVAAVGAPDAFFAQLRQLGAHVQEAPYRDHHRFTRGDAAALARRAGAGTVVVCTLKDAVKLSPVWPRAAAPLWYVSQVAEVESGAPVLARGVESLLAARAPGGR